MSYECVGMWCYTETLVYRRVNVSVGDTAELMCNTSVSSHIMWTYDNDTEDGYVNYIYWSGVADSPRLLTSSPAAGVHAILITNAELTDSGLYDCYDGKGSRQVGYQLIVNGILWFIIHIYLRLFIYITMLKATSDGKSTR